MILNISFLPCVIGRNINNYLIPFENIYIQYLPENEKLYSNHALRTKEIFKQNKLDQIVYELYGLTEEEIQIVEDSFKQ